MIGVKGNNKKLKYYEVKDYIEYYEKNLISKEYKNAKTKMKVKCWNNHIYLISWNNFYNGSRCPKCANCKRGDYKKLTLEYIKIETPKLAKGYECLATEYINSQTKYNNRCNEGHIHEVTWNNFKRGQRCPICWRKSILGKNHPFWKGGVKKKDIPLFDTYAYQIEWCEEVRRDPENNNYLQVKCTNSKCRKWLTPSTNAVKNRIKTLFGKTKYGESRFYCSEECKQSCSIFYQIKYPKGFRNTENDRLDQKEWADLVKERDGYQCVKCGNTEDLIAHHIEGLNVNPIESADVDIGITLCKKCDKEAHSEIGCRYVDLQKNRLCVEV